MMPSLHVWYWVVVTEEVVNQSREDRADMPNQSIVHPFDTHHQHSTYCTCSHVNGYRY
jgi:hypothetical protein